MEIAKKKNAQFLHETAEMWSSKLASTLDFAMVTNGGRSRAENLDLVHWASFVFSAFSACFSAQNSK